MCMYLHKTNSSWRVLNILTILSHVHHLLLLLAVLLLITKLAWIDAIRLETIVGKAIGIVLVWLTLRLEVPLGLGIVWFAFEVPLRLGIVWFALKVPLATCLERATTWTWRVCFAVKWIPT